MQTIVFGVGERTLAVPLGAVSEIMRPLPLEPVPGPEYIVGLSLIRGVPTPVIDVSRLLQLPAPAHERLVALRVDDRAVALLVTQVHGLRTLDRASLHALPPLLTDAKRQFIEHIGTHDAALLMVLHGAWSLP